MVWCSLRISRCAGTSARSLTSTVIRSIDTRPTIGAGAGAGVEVDPRRAERAQQAVGVARGQRRHPRRTVGAPVGAVADGLARDDVADLDHRQRETDHRPRVGEGEAAEEAHAGAGQVEMVVPAEQESAGGREAAARVRDAVREGGEGFGLCRVHRMTGLVRAGEVAEDERRGELSDERERPRRVPRLRGRGGSCRCRSGARGFGPEADSAKSCTCALLLRQGVRSKSRRAPRRRASGRRGRGSPGLADRAAQRCAFLRERDEEAAHAGGRQRRADPGRAEPVGVGLEHGGGRDIRRRTGRRARASWRRSRRGRWSERRARWRNSRAGSARVGPEPPAGVKGGRDDVMAAPLNACMVATKSGKRGGHEHVRRDRTGTGSAGGFAVARGGGSDSRRRRGGRPRRASGGAGAAARGRYRRSSRTGQPQPNGAR